MKTKTFAEYTQKTPIELQKEVVVKKKELVKTALEYRKGTVKNVRTMRNLRRDIAQLKTLINEKLFVQKTKQSGKTAQT